MDQLDDIRCVDLYKNTSLTNEDQCRWISEVDDCYTKSYINYISIFFCSLNDSNTLYAFKFFLLILWMIYLFTAVQTIAASFMCPSLLGLSKLFKLSENISSVTFYSFGVATPCIFSAISGIMNGKPKIVISALFGSATMITQLIIGSIFALSSFKVEILPFLRDVLAYVVLIAWVFYIFVIKKQIQVIDAFGFLIFYVIYILVAFITPRNENLMDEEEDHIDDEMNFELSTISNSLNITPVDNEKSIKKIFYNILTPIDKQEWIRSNQTQKLILIIKLPILIFVQLTCPAIESIQKLKKLTLELRFKLFVQMVIAPQLILEIFSLNKNNYIIREDIPISMVVLIVCIFGALFFYYFVDNLNVFRIYCTFHAFIMSIFWVYIICEEVVTFLRALSIKLNLSEEFIGLTILAWGNASLDYFCDIQITMQGKPRLASSATIIAPFISLLLGVGIPCALLFSTSELNHLPVDLNEQLMTVMISVVAGLILITLHLILKNFVVWRPFGLFIILLYLITIILEFLIEFDIWHLPASYLHFKT